MRCLALVLKNQALDQDRASLSAGTEKLMQPERGGWMWMEVERSRKKGGQGCHF